MRIKTLLPIALALSMLFAFSCGKRLSEEDIVRAAVEKAAKAAEAKDAAAFMKLVSKDYRDAYGNDYNAVKGILLHQFLRPGPVKVFIRGLEVEVKGDAALVDARVILVLGREVKTLGDIVPEDADAKRFSAVYQKEGRTWRVKSAEWESVGVAGLL